MTTPDVVGLGAILLGGVLVAVMMWALHRLFVIATIVRTLWHASPTDTPEPTPGQPIALTGTVVVDAPAPIAERLFAPTDRPVGAYLWRAWFTDTGRYTYDRERGELRKGRNTFAAGIEVGDVGLTANGHRFGLDFAWLRTLYDADRLADLEIGTPTQNTKLPTFLTRYSWDSLYLAVSTPRGDCDLAQLTDVVSTARESVDTDGFGVEARGLTAGQRVFVYGELRENADGDYTIGGTDTTPLLVSTTGREGLFANLRWRALKYLLALGGAVGLFVLFVL